MLLKNIASQGMFLYEYVVATGLPKTGDAANITGYWSLDGGTATVFGTTNPTELSATHMPGVYWQPLAQGETNGNAIAYSWSSTTSGIAIDPVIVLTTGVSIPAVAYAGANGLITEGTGTGQLATSSGQVTVGTNADKTGYSLTVTPPTAAAIATAVLTDTGDNTTLSSPGKILAQLGAAFTTTSSSIYSTASLANAPTGGTAPTVSQIATGIWQDLTASGDFGTTGSIGLLLKTNINAQLSTLSTYAGGAVASVTGSVGSVTGAVGSVTSPVSVLLTQTLSAARPLDVVVDTSLTLNDALQCAIAAVAGQQTTSGTSYVVSTPHTNTTLRTFTLTMVSPPATVPSARN